MAPTLREEVGADLEDISWSSEGRTSVDAAIGLIALEGV